MNNAADRAADELLGAAQTIASASRDIRDIQNDLSDTQDELLETRVWVGDLAHCLIYEADLGRYDYWEATRTGTVLGSGNRGEWGTAFGGEAQVSHCSR